MEDWVLGTIPWSVVDLAEVMAFELKLLARPKDDWDIDAGEHPIDFGMESEGSTFATREALLHALCTCPFSEECTRRGLTSRRFRFTEVVTAAEAFKPE